MSIEAPALKKSDFVSGQDVRWCPGCGDYAILNVAQKVMPRCVRGTHGFQSCRTDGAQVRAVNTPTRCGQGVRAAVVVVTVPQNGSVPQFIPKQGTVGQRGDRQGRVGPLAFVGDGQHLATHQRKAPTKAQKA